MIRDEAAAAANYVESQPAPMRALIGERACYKCTFWRPDPVPSRHDWQWVGRCEANSPQALGGEFYPFPSTEYDLWCGQFIAGPHNVGRCGECKFWAGGTKTGQCRAQAPIINTRPSQMGLLFPYTDIDEGCAANTPDELGDVF
jgi:hypothetical protein